MARGDLRITRLSEGETFRISSDISRLFIECDVHAGAVLQGGASKLKVQVKGNVMPGAKVQLTGPNAALEVKGSISGSLILLDGVSLATSDKGRLDPATHVHARGACGKLVVAGRGHGVLIVEPDAYKKVGVQLGKDKQDILPNRPMKAAGWLPYLLPGNVPIAPSYGNYAGVAGFSIGLSNFKEYRQSYLKDFSKQLRLDCSYCRDLRTTLQNLG